jgi:hypothetical protein
MSMSVDGNFITYNDGTKQQSANFRVLDTNVDNSPVNYAIGTYMLIDTKHYNSRTSPIPLDGWGRFYAGGPTLFTSPTSAGATGAIAIHNPTVGILQYVASSGNNGAAFSCTGTWVSRGSGLSQAFAVRVA